MAYIDMELVKGPELRTIIEAANGCGLLPEPIDLKKGRRIANLAGDFVKGIEAVNAVGKLDDVPEAVFNYYVGIVKEGDPPGAAAKKEEEAAKKAEAAAKRKAAAEAKKAATADGGDQKTKKEMDKLLADAKKKEAAEAKAKKATEAKAKKAADAKAKKEAAAAKKADAKAKADADKAAKATAKKRDEAAKAKAKAAPAKKAPAKKAPAKKAPAKPKKAIPVKAAIFGKLLLSKKAKKWDVKELVEALAAKTESPYVDTRRKCNTYIALLRTMGVLEDAGDKLVMADWYRKALTLK